MEMEITIDNIKDIKKNRIHKGYIALFYSNSCGHCVHFMPIWETLKKKLSKEYHFLELEYSNMQKLDKDFIFVIYILVRTVQYSKLQYSTVQYSRVEYSIVQYRIGYSII